MRKRGMDSWTHFLLTSWAFSCLGNCSSLASTNPKDPHPRPFHKLQILSLPSNKLLSSVSSLSSSSRLSSDSLKSSSLLLGLEGRSCAEEVDSSKDSISVLSLPKALSLASLLVTFRSLHRGSKAVCWRRCPALSRTCSPFMSFL